MNSETGESNKSMPLSQGQEALWSLWKTVPRSGVYNINHAWILHDPIDPGSLYRVLQHMGLRNPSWRSLIVSENGTPMRRIVDRLEIPLERVDARDWSKTALEAFLRRTGFRSFDLEREAPIRWILIEHKDQSILYMQAHHIACDGWSIMILINQLRDLYRAALEGDLPAITPPAKGYADFVAWQQKYLQSTRGQRAADFWKEQLSGDLPVMDLPADNKRPVRPSYGGHFFMSRLPDETAGKLFEMAAKLEVFPAVPAIAAFQVLLQRYCGTHDIRTGTATAARRQFNHLVDFFANPVVIRNRIDRNGSFEQLVHLTAGTFMSAVRHQDMPFTTIVRERGEWDQSRSPIFDFQLLWEDANSFVNADDPLVSLDEQGRQIWDMRGMRWERLMVKPQVDSLDLTLRMICIGDVLFTLFDYSDLFHSQTIERLSEHFHELLAAVLRAPHQPLDRLSFINERERALLEQFNRTDHPFPQQATIHDFLIRQARRQPHESALIMNGEVLDYQQLEAASAAMALALGRAGATPGDVVAILEQRSFSMMIAIYGAVRAGCVYLPLDPAYPADRLDFMLQDSGAVVLVASNHFAGGANFGGPTILLDQLPDERGGLPCLTPEHGAYLIYTSGSSGRPKGVLVSHRAAVNRLHWMQRCFSLREQDVILQKTPISFDVSVWELFWWSMPGAQLCLLAPGGEKEPRLIVETIRQNGVTTLHFVPSMLALFLDYLAQSSQPLDSLERVFTSGEALPPSLANRFRRQLPHVELHNLYGPTEACVDVTWFDCGADADHQRIPIGKPIDNIRIHITDNRLELQPMGVPGELCIAGVGLALGYLNRPALTAERFVPNPLGGGPGSRLYRTGDLTRLSGNGNILFMGRLDFQVKVRGFRIEPAEIEARLLELEGIREACVMVHNQVPAAWYTGKPRDPDRLREDLSRILPDYMTPAWFTHIPHMPLSPSGKRDRKALPAPEGARLETTYEAPRDQMDQQLAALWQEVLDVDRIGINDNFFALGGHSLKAVSLGLRILHAFRVDIPLARLLEHPTIKTMRAYIQGAVPMHQYKIPKADPRSYWPLSPAQRRMVLFHQIKGPNVVYNLPTALEIEGPLSEERFRNALQELAMRHQALRTCFRVRDGEPVQIIIPRAVIPLEWESCDMPATQRIREFVQPFELERAPLARALLLTIEPDKHLFVLDMHHVIADEVSCSVLTRELMTLYEGRSLPSGELQYTDFAVWHNQRLAAGQLDAAKAVHLRRLAGDLPILDLPHDLPRKSEMGMTAGCVTFYLTPELTQTLEELARSRQVTVNMLLLAAYHTWLSLYSGQYDVVTGIPAAGRPHGTEHLVGLFVNTLAIRSQPAPDKRFCELLEEVAGYLVEAFDHGEVPFDVLVDALPPAPGGRHPVFDAFFVMQDSDPVFNTTEVEVRVHHIQMDEAKFDLLLGGRREADRLGFSLRCRADLFSEQRARQMADHFHYLLRQLAADPQIAMDRLEKTTPEQKRQLVFDFNQTSAQLPEHADMVSLFMEQVAAHPHKTALVFGEQTMDYQTLSNGAAGLAEALQGKGVRAGQIVGLMCDRGMHMIVGILGILKAGAAYLPLDPQTPPDRLAFMLKDSATNVLVTAGVDQPDTDIRVLPLEHCGPGTLVSEPGDMRRPAYVIYTSGSTGKPKGVVVCHRNVVNLLMFFRDNLGIDYSINSIQFAPFTFDASAGEIFMSLLNGCTLHLLPMSVIGNPDAFQTYLSEHNIGFAAFPPAYLAMLDPMRLTCLKKVMTAGSAPDADLPRKWSGVTDYINGYGPTETTIISTAWQRDDGPVRDHHIPIGRPICNTRIYLLDEQSGLVPMGGVGELCIAGEGLAGGYLNRPGLTAEKFVPNPHVPGETIYRTGDLARYLDDEGHLEFVGRIDQQVKIRGFRIELGEIEFHLKQHPEAGDVVVIDRAGQQGAKYLCVYYTGSMDDGPAWLTSRLPGYMVPDHFVRLDCLPLTARGKIDRQALPEPNTTDREFHELHGPIEEKLAVLWRRVLGMEIVSREDNFFETGGQSLKAMELSVLISKEFGQNFPIARLFENPTIADLAPFLEEGRADQSIEPAPVADSYPLSSAQRRLWLLERMEGSGTAYLMPMTLRISGDVDVDGLRNALELLIKRHGALRTDFIEKEWEPRQRIHETTPLPFNHSKLDNADPNELAASFLEPFPLDAAPLMRAALVSTGPREHLLFMVVHHLIADGLSLEIMLREWLELYAGTVLQPPALHLHDYVYWLNQQSSDSQASFWKNMYAKPVEPLELSDTQPTEPSFHGATHRLLLPPPLVTELESLAKTHQTTLFISMLAAAYVLLGRYTAREDVVLGTPVAGRNRPETASMVGLFVNTLALRAGPRAELSFEDFLDQVRRMVSDAFANADYPFDQLVEELGLERDARHNPLFDIMFLMEPVALARTEIAGLKVEGIRTPYPISQFPITFILEPHGDGLMLGLLYRTQLFTPQAMEKLGNDYMDLLETLTRAPDTPIGSIKLHKAEEIVDSGFEDVEFDF